MKRFKLGRKTSWFVSLCMVALCDSGGHAQVIQFNEISQPVMGLKDVIDIGLREGGILHEDFNQDGHKDVIIAGRDLNAEQKIFVYQGSAAGTFTLVTNTGLTGIASGDIACADYDLDGRLDLFVTGFSSSSPNSCISKLYKNLGSFNFLDVGGPFTPLLQSSVAMEDMDGDNKPEIIISGLNSSLTRTLKFYTQNTSGSYYEVTVNGATGVNNGRITIGKIGGTAYKDVLITGEDATGAPLTQYYRISNVSPMTFNKVYTNIPNYSLGSVRMADIDGDSDLDILFSGYSAVGVASTKVYRNNGSNSFAQYGSNIDDLYGEYLFLDFDGDNDVDIVGLGSSTPSYGWSTFNVYKNNGTGTFTSDNSYTRLMRLDAESGSGIAIDLDGDGKKDDFAFTGYQAGLSTTHIYSNTNSVLTRLTKLEPSDIPSIEGAISKLVDLNNDNINDIFTYGAPAITGGQASLTCKLYLGNSSGEYIEKDISMTFAPFAQPKIGIADMNNDNLPDFIITGKIDGIVTAKMYLNTGSGNFVESSGALDPIFLSSFAFGNLNNDQYTDVVINGFDQNSTPLTRVYLGSASGNLTLLTNVYDQGGHLPGVAAATSGIFDLNGDGLDDIYISGSNVNSSLGGHCFINNGNNTFTPSTDYNFGYCRNGSIFSTDIDGDGDEDIIIGGTNQYYLGEVRVYRKETPSTYSTNFQSFDGHYEGNINIVDVDNDGDIDIFVSGSTDYYVSSQITQFYLNDGQGNYSLRDVTTPIDASFTSSSFAQMDGDLLPEMIFSASIPGYSPITKLYKNNSCSAPIPTPAVLADLTAACEITTLTAPTATTNCGATVTTTHNATLPIRSSQTITWTHNAGNGNITTQTQQVIITDNVAPVPVLENLLPVTAECSLTTLPEPEATDNCSQVTVTHNAMLPLTHTQLVTWTYRDGNGNSATQTQLFTIFDETAPVPSVASLPALTAECILFSLTPPTALDNCAGTIEGEHDQVLPITSNTTITWTYVDEYGNESTQTQDVVITDDVTAPVVSSPTLPTYEAGCSVYSFDEIPVAMDACDGEIIGVPDVTLPIHDETLVTWTFTDASGNESTQTQLIKTTDNTPPIIYDYMGWLNEAVYDCPLSPVVTPYATDNCSDTVYITHNATYPLANEDIITWTFDDGNGNIVTAQQMIFIYDENAPEVDAATPTYIESECIIETLTVPVVSDCSGIAVLSHDAILPITEYTEVEWYFEDSLGNYDTFTQYYEVTGDTVKPVVNTTQLPEIISICAINSLDTPTATDNCSGMIDGTSTVTFPIEETTEVVWTYVDAENNQIQQTQSIVILDIDNSLTVEGVTVSSSLNTGTFQWVDCDNNFAPIAGETNATFTATENGNYALVVTLNGCSDTTSCVSISTVGIEDVKWAKLEVYPNPTTGAFVLNSSTMLSNATVEVFSSVGQLIQTIQFTGNTLELDLTSEPNGVYTVRLNNNQHVRIVKQ